MRSGCLFSNSYKGVLVTVCLVFCSAQRLPLPLPGNREEVDYLRWRSTHHQHTLPAELPRRQCSGQRRSPGGSEEEGRRVGARKMSQDDFPCITCSWSSLYGEFWGLWLLCPNLQGFLSMPALPFSTCSGKSGGTFHIT